MECLDLTSVNSTCIIFKNCQSSGGTSFWNTEFERSYCTSNALLKNYPTYNIKLGRESQESKDYTVKSQNEEFDNFLSYYTIH